MECSVNFLQLILAVFLKGSVELTLTPSPAITYLGGTINFTCNKSDPSVAIAWETKLVQNHYFVANNESTTVLSVTFNSSNASFNNSYVRCVGHPANNPTNQYCSNLVQIKLQGILSEVDATVKNLSTCILEVYWDPPFTLESVPILGYNVNITNLDTNVTVSSFTQDTSYNITLSYYDYKVSIAGVNGAGEGNKTYLNIKLQNQTISVVGDVAMSRNDKIWMIDATVIEKYVCLDENPNILFHICNESECWEALCTQTEHFGDKRKLTANLNLPDNHHYYLTIFSTIGKYNLSSKREVISTFDIQSVHVWPSSNICVTLYYARGSIANGTLVIKCDSDITLSYYVCGRNSGDKNSKGFCQTEFSFTGNRKCTLMAYDEVNGIIQNKTGPAVVMNIELTGTKDAAGTNKFWTAIGITGGLVANLVVVATIVITCIIQKVIRPRCINKNDY